VTEAVFVVLNTVPNSTKENTVIKFTQEINNLILNKVQYFGDHQCLHYQGLICNTRGSHGGEDVDVGLLGCNVLCNGTQTSKLLQNVDIYLYVHTQLQPRRRAAHKLCELHIPTYTVLH
jgi:hypothetical protein